MLWGHPLLRILFFRGHSYFIRTLSFQGHLLLRISLIRVTFTPLNKWNVYHHILRKCFSIGTYFATYLCFLWGHLTYCGDVLFVFQPTFLGKISYCFLESRKKDSSSFIHKCFRKKHRRRIKLYGR